MGSSGGGGGDQTTTIRYAPYIEDKHEDFLDAVATYRASLTDSSPFTDYTDIVTEAAFFGTGKYFHGTLRFRPAPETGTHGALHRKNLTVRQNTQRRRHHSGNSVDST